MILELLDQLTALWSGFAVLESLVVRAALAAVLAFITALLLGPRVLAWLRRRAFIEKETATPSAELNERNRGKSPTPTMGGLMILGAILVAGVLCGDLRNDYVSLGLLATVGFGCIGFIDDWVKLTHAGRTGLSVRAKAALQLFVALALALAITHIFQSRAHAEQLLRLRVPFSDGAGLDLSWWGGLPHVVLVLMVVIVASNAVNLTDGMDGLAAGSMAVAAAAMAAVCVAVGRAASLVPDKPQLYVPFSQEMTVFCAAMAGATLGFLWFNEAPALIYMGDTGSLPLGGLLGYVAVVAKSELLLVLIGGVFVLEALSVMLQVSWFRATGGRRILRCAPLHHHFQFGGMPTTRIVIRFWIVSVLLAAAGLASLVAA